MGFFTILAWVWLALYGAAFVATALEYGRYQTLGLGEFYLAQLKPTGYSVLASIVALCWLGWRYFGN